MNFLLHLIGMTHRDAALRPTLRQSLMKAVCGEALAGHFAGAAQRLNKVAQNAGHGVLPLICAHLHLAAHDYRAAADSFSVGVARLNGTENSCVSEFGPMSAHTEDPLPAPPPPAREGATTRLERLIDSADVHLRQGRYVRAVEFFQQARTLLDTLLSAHAGMIVADARVAGRETPESSKPLVALANLGDLLLRMLARTHLASNVAAGLRERSLRDDLAPWATTGSDVDGLLRSEFGFLLESTRQNPDHAETHYRLGLVARAIGDRKAAERAFARVVQLHPHHVLSAARLAATLLQIDQPDAVMPLLATVFAVPSQTLRNHERLANTVSDRRSFDRAVARLCHDLGDHPNVATVRANLAFALGEVGLLDEEHAAWRETVPAA